MARPLSEAKREAILASATDLVAVLGTGAPTARIAQQAGIAEGTLFKYFASKDDLLNALYLELKADLARTFGEDFPSRASLRERCLSIWNRWVDWGARYPNKRKAMRQLSVSERITPASRQAGTTGFLEIAQTLEEAVAAGSLRGQSLSFIGSLLEALADTTLESIAQNPERREDYQEAAFHILWSGLSA